MERRCHKCNTCCQLENNTPKKSVLKKYQEMLKFFHDENAWVDGEPLYQDDWHHHHHHHHHHHCMPYWEDIPYMPDHHIPHRIPDDTDYVPDWSRPSDHINCAFANMAWWMWQQWNLAPWLYSQLQNSQMPCFPNVPMPEYQGY